MQRNRALQRRRLPAKLIGFLAVAGIAMAVALASVARSDSPLPPEKQAVLDQEAAFRSAAALLPTAAYRGLPPTRAVTPAPDPGIPAGSGAIYYGNSPLPAQAFFLQERMAGAGRRPHSCRVRRSGWAGPRAGSHTRSASRVSGGRGARSNRGVPDASSAWSCKDRRRSRQGSQPPG